MHKDFPKFHRIPQRTKMTYEEWSEKNPIKWDEIEDTEDCLITKTGVEMFHYQTYLLECKKND
jgi:hypothetical protein